MSNLLEQYEQIRDDLSDEERLERLELVVLTMAQLVDEQTSRYDAALARLEGILGRVEKEGPAALLGSMMGARRRRKAA